MHNKTVIFYIWLKMAIMVWPQMKSELCIWEYIILIGGFNIKIFSMSIWEINSKGWDCYALCLVFLVICCTSICKHNFNKNVCVALNTFVPLRQHCLGPCISVCRERAQRAPSWQHKYTTIFRMLGHSYESSVGVLKLNSCPISHLLPDLWPHDV